MTEIYISPVLNVVCFAPVERLASNEDILDISTVTEVRTYGGGKTSGVDVDDEDFGLDIL